jgi:hypothetical protein
LQSNFYKAPAIAIALLCTATACKRPKDIATEKVMAQLLMDIQIADAYATICYLQDTATPRNNLSRNIDTLKLYSAIALKKNNFTEQQYKHNLKWYLAHPQQIDSAYNCALLLAEKMQVGLAR